MRTWKETRVDKLLTEDVGDMLALAVALMDFSPFYFQISQTLTKKFFEITTHFIKAFLHSERGHVWLGRHHNPSNAILSNRKSSIFCKAGIKTFRFQINMTAYGVSCMVNVSNIHTSPTQLFYLTDLTYGHHCAVNWCLISLFATPFGCVQTAAKERDVIPWAVSRLRLT
jgi:hypothetical protein